MLFRKTMRIGLVTTVLILPSCATSRQNEPIVIGASAQPEMYESSSIVQTAYQAESEEPPIEPPQLQAEVVPVPVPLQSPESESRALHLGELEQMALTNNPSLAEAGARVEAARGKWLQVGLHPNPRIGYSGQQLGSNGQAEQQGVYVEQELIRGGKLRLNREVASREVARAEQLFAEQQRRVLTDVRVGYYTVLCAQEQLKLTEELVRIGNQATAAADNLLAIGEGSRRDLLQARIDRNSARNVQQEAQSQHLAAWRMLAAVLGTPDVAPRELAGELDESIAEIAWENSLQRLRQESPEIAAAYTEVERARFALDRASVQSVPDLNVQGTVQYDNSTGGSNGALLISLPIPLLDRNQGGIHQAQFELVAARRAAERLELGLQHRLAPVFERYSSNRKRVDNYRNGMLSDAQESLDLTRQGYKSGEISFLNLLTAQRTYYRVNLDYVESICEMWKAHAEIEGLLLTNSFEKSTGA